MLQKLIPGILIGIIVFSFSVSALGPTFTSYTGCTDPSLDTGGKSCTELNSGVCTGSLSVADEYYLLMTDLTTLDQDCFNINANNISFNMNNHTISFTQETNNVQIFYMLIGVATNSEVFNGRIIELPHAVYQNEYASAIYTSCDGCSVHDIYILTNSNTMKAARSGGAGSTVEFYNNYFFNNDTYITNAHSVEYYGTVEINHGATMPGTTIIRDSILEGRSNLIYVQRGESNVQIYNNKLYPWKKTRNPYAIRFYHAYDTNNIGSEVYNNTIISNNSRGIIIGTSNGIKVYNNYIDVAEEHIPGVDDGGGSFAFRMRYDSENNEIYNNIIKTRALLGQGINPKAFMASPRGYPLANSIYNNTFIAFSEDPSLNAISFAIDGDDNSLPGDYSTYIIENNTVIGNSILLYYGIANGPAHNARLVSTTLRRETPVGTFRTIVMGFYENGNTGNVGHSLINTIFENGASDLDLTLIETGKPKELFLDWYLDVTVRDNGVIVSAPEATVTITDNQSNIIYSGSTTNGVIPKQTLSEYQMYTTTLSPSYNYYTPHNVTVTYLSKTQSRLVTMNSSKTEVFDFSSGPCTENTTRQCGTTDVGACSYGTETCTGGTWQACIGNIEPVTEICENAIDDDCDTLTDYNDTVDCTAPTCTLTYDVYPCDCINSGELSSTITGWYNNQINIAQLIVNIKTWKGCN